MLLKDVDLVQKLNKIKSKDVNFNKLLESFYQKNKEDKAIILSNLSSVNNQSNSNNLNFDLLESSKIYHLDQIKKICIDYRLRFLDTKYFKGDYPDAVIDKIKSLEQDHSLKLQNFKIIAPSKLFVLKKADDPLLFAPMGNGYYYLIHKWGKDLHPLRKIKVWTVKNVGNLAFTTLVFSVLLTLFSKDFIFNGTQKISYNIMLFMFIFKFAIGFILFFGIASGKSFNEYIWQSRYDKVQ